MRIIEGPSSIEKLPLDGNGADIVDGAYITPGITAGQDLSVFVKAAADGAQGYGCLLGLHDFSEVGDSTPEDGLVHVFGEVETAKPGAIIQAEYSQATADLITVTSYAAPVITVTNLEDNIDGSWVYVVEGTGLGQLGYLDASAAGNATLKSAFTTALDNTSKFVKILRPGHALLAMTTNRDELKSQAAAGTFTAKVLYSEIRFAGSQGWERLDPTKHHNLQGLTSKQFKVRSRFAPLNTFFSSDS